MSPSQRSLTLDNDVPLLENEEEASTVESVIERELEDDEVDVEIQRVSQIKDASEIQRPSSRADDLGKKFLLRTVTSSINQVLLAAFDKLYSRVPFISTTPYLNTVILIKLS